MFVLNGVEAPRFLEWLRNQTEQTKISVSLQDARGKDVAIEETDVRLIFEAVAASPMVISNIRLVVCSSSKAQLAIRDGTQRLREAYGRNMFDRLLFELFLGDMRKQRILVHRRRVCPILRLPLHDLRLRRMLASYVCNLDAANDIYVVVGRVIW